MLNNFIIIFLNKKEMNIDPQNPKRCYTFYYKITAQDLVVYVGTLQADILSTLYTILDIEPKTKLMFLDDQGLPMVLSSMMPDKTKIFIKDNEATTIKTADPIVLSPWVWDRKQSKGVDFVDEKTFSTLDVHPSWVYGSLKFDKGIHYWSLKISHIFCCHDLGITKEESNDCLVFHKTLTIGLPEKFPNKDSGPMSTGCSTLEMKDHIIGCYLDMDKKVFFIFNETEKVLYTKAKITFQNAIPFYASRKHDVVITLVNSGCSAPQWMLDEIKNMEFK